VSGWQLRWKPRGAPHTLVDGSSLRPDLLGPLALDAMARVEVEAGGRALPLGELFAITALPGERSAGEGFRLRVEGSVRFLRLGAGMGAGRLEVDGPAGDLAGAGMTGGEFIVRGDAGHGAGAAMAGGRLRVEGGAGGGLGGPLPGRVRGMSGGELLVLGNAGDQAGFRMRRGLIAVAGAAGDCPGYFLGAGTIVVGRGELAGAGLEMRRGSIIGLSARQRPGTGFRRDGPVAPVWLRLLARRLRELDFPLDEAARAALEGSRPLESWSGDLLSLGRGEVLLPVEE
jgi:formylmethanofuran dehydrogenase subunit C